MEAAVSISTRCTGSAPKAFCGTVIPVVPRVIIFIEKSSFKNRLNFEIQGMIIFIRIWIYFNMIHEVFQYKITERRDGKAVRI